MRARVRWLIAVGCCAGLAACGGSDDGRPDPRAPVPAPPVTLTAQDRRVWAQLPPDRSAIPVLLYHGLGTRDDFSHATDADFGVNVDDFAKQMTMIKHAGYQTIDLATFVRFIRGERVRLPPRPLLLTFDDGRADSWTGSDGILDKLGFNAVMFVDVGPVDAGDPEYLTWEELKTMQDSGRWNLQLHSGKGHHLIRFGPGDHDYGPFYAFLKEGETFDDWRDRVRSDIEWGEQTLADHVAVHEPRAFAPPFGNFGQDGTNDDRIPDDLLGWLSGRFAAIFTQDVNGRARPGTGPPQGRIQVTRATTGGELHDELLSGEWGNRTEQPLTAESAG